LYASLKLREKVERAIAYLSAKNPGLGGHVAKYSVKVGAREGGYAYFDYRDGSVVVSKEWLYKLDHKGLGELLAHEALHGVLGHWIYLKERKVSHPLLWNLACDIEVNSILEELGLFSNLYSSMIKLTGSEPVTWRRFRFIGVGPKEPAELIYEKLLNSINNNELRLVIENQRGEREAHGRGERSYYDFTVVVSDVVDSVSNEERRVYPKEKLWHGSKDVEEEFKKSYEYFKNTKDPTKLKDKVVEQAVELAVSLRRAGNLPGGLERFVAPSKPQVQWALLLRSALKKGTIKSVRSWQVPNRRGLEGVPGYLRTGNNLWLLVDTSASITDEELSTFLAEVVAISKLGKVNLVTWDVEPNLVVTAASRSRLLNYVKKSVKGGGGTLSRPALEFVYKKMRRGDVVVVLTDGYWFDETEVTDVMRKIKKYSSAAVLVTVGTVPEDAREAGWTVIRIKRA